MEVALVQLARAPVDRDTHALADALHAVVVDSASRLQPKITRRAALASGQGGGDRDARYEEAVYASSLLVQDPLSHNFSNISATTFRWSHVQRCFREALERLHGALRATGGVHASMGAVYCMSHGKSPFVVIDAAPAA